jgi:hypothetical protein
MKSHLQNTIQLNRSGLNDEILRSMISSFKIEDIIISDTVAQSVHEKVKARLKKQVG